MGLALKFDDFLFNKTFSSRKNSLEIDTLVPLLVDDRETLEPPISI